METTSERASATNSARIYYVVNSASPEMNPAGREGARGICSTKFFRSDPLHEIEKGPDAVILVNINPSMNVPRPALVMTRVISFSYTRTFHEQEANHYRMAFGAFCRDDTSTRNYCPVNFSFKPQSHSGARGPSPRPPHSSRPDPKWRSLSFNS